MNHGIENWVLTSGDRLASSTNQDAAHFFVCGKRFQGNGGATRTRAREGSLSHRDLDLRRGAFRQNAVKKKRRAASPRKVSERVYVANRSQISDEPRVPLGDGAGSAVQRGVQF